MHVITNHDNIWSIFINNSVKCIQTILVFSSLKILSHVYHWALKLTDVGSHFYSSLTSCITLDSLIRFFKPDLPI